MQQNSKYIYRYYDLRTGAHTSPLHKVDFFQKEYTMKWGRSRIILQRRNLANYFSLVANNSYQLASIMIRLVDSI